MATYKIPQDVEAEDKLIGPFSFKQFIFLIIAAIGIGMAILFFRIQPFLVVIPLPVVIIFLILGIYRREDQPVETYLMAALNFQLKPRKRIWDPEGLVETVHITAPKKFAKPALKKMGAQEHSQLERLAKIVDTRGWATKQPELTEPLDGHALDEDDRLAIQASATTIEPLDVHASDDILDPYNNPRAQDFTKLAQSSHANAKATAIAKMKAVANAQQVKATAQAQQPDDTTVLPKNVQYNPYPSMHQRVVGGNDQAASTPKG